MSICVAFERHKLKANWLHISLDMPLNVQMIIIQFVKVLIVAYSLCNSLKFNCSGHAIKYLSNYAN